MPAHSTTVRVRYADTDKGGIVYHANYIRWFEVGRAEAMRGCGIPYTELESHGVSLPVIDLHARYHRPALYDQELEVLTWITELTRTRVRFEYALRLASVLPANSTERHPETGQPLVTGHTVHVPVDTRGRVVRFDRYSEMWARLQTAAASLRSD